MATSTNNNAREIIFIEPLKAVETQKLKVAGYARVSSDSADQLNSFAAQVIYYTQLIEENQKWELVEVYADEGVTGVSTEKRDDFNRMIKDCRNGKIDRIITKSVSRFARNTLDSIVSREIFQQAQQERARRNSKKKVSQNTVTEQGKYSSAYALTDILICGHCGTPYRRTTWRKRNGDKQVVWRCINRLEYGRKYCKDSVTVDEERLKQTIINALRESTMDSNGLIPILNAHIERALWHTAGGQVNIEEIESRMEKLKKDTMELMSQSIANNTVVENEARLKAMNDEIMDLYEMVVQYKENNSTKNTISKKLKEYTEFLRVDTAESDTYNDTLVRQLIHTIKVMDDYITIYFKNGTEWTQPMDLKVRRLRK